MLMVGGAADKSDRRAGTWAMAPAPTGAPRRRPLGASHPPVSFALPECERRMNSTARVADRWDTGAMRSQQEYVLRTVEERAIRFVQLWFTDVLGTAKTFSITPAELENALEEGMTFDGSAIDGFSRVQESDVLARPDPKTFQLLPWNPDDVPVARVFCDIFNLDGTPFEGCPRHALRRTLDRAREQGFTFFASPEIEYFYFADADPSATPVTLDAGSYFELTANDLASELRKESVLTLEDMGVPVEHAQHEDAPSQHEIDLRYTDALTMADTVMTVRLVVKETARRHGVHASFMPKPLAGVQGSGMHTHLSLFEGDTNAFYDAADPYGLSQVAKRFVAGLLRHAHEITAVTNQWVNSYKRLVTGYEAPIHVSWARNNRSALVRVPVVKRAKPESTRVEYRAPDSAANPYLAFAVMLAAGLKGIEEGYELPREATANLFAMTPEELAADGIRPLPSSLSEAIVDMERSELVAETLGEHVFEWFIRNKRAEWAAYKTQITQFELDRYLPLL
jgi:glutamine synthetase